MRILVVDDDEQLLSVTKHMFEFFKYEVVADLDSNNALRIFKEDPNFFDLLYTDQCIPKGINGTELIAKILLIRPNMSCIISSGNLTESLLLTINQYKELGFAIEYLAKPFTMDDMQSSIIKATRRIEINN